MSTVKFDYGDVETIHSSINGTIDTIDTGLQDIDGKYKAAVQVSDGAIYGALGEQMLLNWDNVSSSFPAFKANFDNWAAVIASSYGNYDAMEEQVKGFREANTHGYSQTLTQRGMQAVADAYAAENGTTAETVTAEAALAEIKGNGTDPANQFAATSPLNNSPVAGYDKENLPKYQSLESATSAEEASGTRSLVDNYVESEDFERTATYVPEGSKEAIEGGDAGEDAGTNSEESADGTAGTDGTGSGDIGKGEGADDSGVTGSGGTDGGATDGGSADEGGTDGGTDGEQPGQPGAGEQQPGKGDDEAPVEGPNGEQPGQPGAGEQPGEGPNGEQPGATGPNGEQPGQPGPNGETPGEGPRPETTGASTTGDDGEVLGVTSSGEDAEYRAALADETVGPAYNTTEPELTGDTGYAPGSFGDAAVRAAMTPEEADETIGPAYNTEEPEVVTSDLVASTGDDTPIVQTASTGTRTGGGSIGTGYGTPATTLGYTGGSFNGYSGLGGYYGGGGPGGRFGVNLNKDV